MMLEWGWDKYINDKNKNKVENLGNTLIEEFWFNAGNDTTQLQVLKKIEYTREQYCGNYDGFFGKVSNYKWKFQSDGSYDITLNLITLGDVIESLQTRVSATNNFLPNKADDDKPLLLAMGNTTIEHWLYNISSDDSNFKDKSDYVKSSFISSFFNKPTTEQLKYQYYVSFKEFIKQIDQLCIPKIKNGNLESPQIYFDNELDQILIKVFPNQISIDPRVCIFNPYLSSKDFSKKPNIDLSIFGQYIIVKNEIVYGQLMNLCLNFDFIIQTIQTNVDKNGKLSLYRFLENICDGINSAIGGVNKLQPIIKEDHIITFIDQSLQSSPEINHSRKDTAKNRNIWL